MIFFKLQHLSQQPQAHTSGKKKNLEELPFFHKIKRENLKSLVVNFKEYNLNNLVV